MPQSARTGEEEYTVTLFVVFVFVVVFVILSQLRTGKAAAERRMEMHAANDAAGMGANAVDGHLRNYNGCPSCGDKYFIFACCHCLHTICNAPGKQCSGFERAQSSCKNCGKNDWRKKP